MERGLSLDVNKAVFFGNEIKWYGPFYSGEATLPDLARVQDLFRLRRPKNGGELMHFIRVMNWLYARFA